MVELPRRPVLGGRLVLGWRVDVVLPRGHAARAARRSLGPRARLRSDDGIRLLVVATSAVRHGVRTAARDPPRAQRPRDRAWLEFASPAFAERARRRVARWLDRERKRPNSS